jgi:hypothetical protein
VEGSYGVEVNRVSRGGHLRAGLSRQMVLRARLVEGGDENLRHAPLIVLIFFWRTAVCKKRRSAEFRTFVAPKGEKQLRFNLSCFRGVSSKWLLLT